MRYTPNSINRFLLYKLPAAWLTGVRVSVINDLKCEVKVRFRWINQNPFRSMYWAVQGMAAELTTGMLVIHLARFNAGFSLVRFEEDICFCIFFN